MVAMFLGNGMTRRKFMGKSAVGAAGLTVASAMGPAALLAENNPSETIGIGMIGIGMRGRGLLRDIMKVKGAEVRGVCDAYVGNLNRSLERVKEVNPKVRTYKDYRGMLESEDIDAVIIATPDHLHAPMTIDSADSGKDVYCEKNMSHTVSEAKDMVAAIKRNKRVFQLGHGGSSRPRAWRSKEIYQSGLLGQVSLVAISRFRNTAIGAWQYNIPDDAGPETVDWERFIGSAPKRPFDQTRFFRWRNYRDYGTGIAGDLLSHAYNSVNLIMDIGIPESCVAAGGIYYWKDGRDVPDVFNVAYDCPDKNLSIVWYSTFGNSRHGTESKTQIFGSNATLEGRQVYLEPEGKSDAATIDKLKLTEESREKTRGDEEIVVYGQSKEDGPEMSGHMQNFVDCIRSREQPRCNEDVGFQVAVTAIMAAVAYERGRKVKWDPVRGEVV